MDINNDTVKINTGLCGICLGAHAMPSSHKTCPVLFQQKKEKRIAQNIITGKGKDLEDLNKFQFLRGYLNNKHTMIFFKWF